MGETCIESKHWKYLGDLWKIKSFVASLHVRHAHFSEEVVFLYPVADALHTEKWVCWELCLFTSDWSFTSYFWLVLERIGKCCECYYAGEDFRVFKSLESQIHVKDYLSSDTLKEKCPYIIQHLNFYISKFCASCHTGAVLFALMRF